MNAECKAANEGSGLDDTVLCGSCHYVMGRPSEWLTRQDLLRAGTLLRGLREFLHKMLTGARELRLRLSHTPQTKEVKERGL